MTRFLNRGLLFVGLAVTVTATMVGTAAASGGDHDASSWGQGGQGASRDWSFCSQDDYDSANHYEGRRGLTAVGLSDQTFVAFRVDRPGSAYQIGTVGGLVGDQYLVGIDYRVQNGALYGVGNAGGVYVLDPCASSSAKVSQLTVALAGTYFGVDFNPAADRLRVISDTGQNLRHDVNPGGVTVVDGPLTYPPAVVPATGLTGAAYTNNDLDPDTATTLFDLDTNLNQVAIQSPANSGQLAPTGKLGVDPDVNAGFDIYSTIRDGRTVAVQGVAVLTANGSNGVFRINILTGEASATGALPANYPVTDLAIPLNQL